MGNVDNTSDLNKPISTATQNALDSKINKGTYTGTAQDLKNSIDGKANTLHTHNISDVTNLQTALDNKQNAIGYTPENVSNKSDSYTVSSSTTYASTKALVDGLATKQNSLTNPITGTGTTNYIPKFTASGTIGNSIVYDNGTNVGIGTTSPSEKLEVNGNVKATQIKDQYGTLKSQRTITITGNITLSETHNGAILHVTNTCNITIPTGLDVNFQCVVYAKGSIIVKFVNGGVTINSPSGLLLKTDKMASLFASASNTFNLLGELATS